ncbi:hypothetical protein GCM10022246_11450 [Pedobacter ginsengiterrae]|uniref:Uncharacterized protein n=1 Tax=Pedobacter ginsengiterrae TaxID=871696 RepID=A0ABP7P4T9_9SPHI
MGKSLDSAINNLFSLFIGYNHFTFLLSDFFNILVKNRGKISLVNQTIEKLSFTYNSMTVNDIVVDFYAFTKTVLNF